jgi:outer membrane protein assembly factor BamB
VDVKTGKQLWQYETPAFVGYWPYTWRVAQGNLIVGFGTGKYVEAINLNTGQRAWISSGFTVVAIETGLDLVFVSRRSELVALDAASGAVRWRIDSMPLDMPILYNPQTQHLVVPHEKLYIIDAQTGTMLATIEKDIIDDCPRPFDVLQLYAGRIYCYEGAYEAETGELISNVSFDLAPYFSLPLIAENVMYSRTGSGTVKAIDLRTMTQSWEYIPSGGDVGKHPVILSNVAIVKSVGYAIADDATIRAFDISSGQEIGWWQAPAVVDWWQGGKCCTSDAIPVAGVASDGSTLFASFGQNTLYAFGP